MRFLCVLSVCECLIVSECVCVGVCVFARAAKKRNHTSEQKVDSTWCTHTAASTLTLIKRYHLLRQNEVVHRSGFNRCCVLGDSSLLPPGDPPTRGWPPHPPRWTPPIPRSPSLHDACGSHLSLPPARRICCLKWHVSASDDVLPTSSGRRWRRPTWWWQRDSSDPKQESWGEWLREE